MDIERSDKAFTTRNSSYHYISIKFIISILLLLLILILVQSQSPPFFNKWRSGLALNATNHPPVTDKTDVQRLISNLQDSVTFLPLKDLRFAKTAMEGNTWFMSSLNDTRNENEAEYLYFPSEMSKGRLLCIKGNNTRDGTKNSYALAWPEALPQSAKFINGLTFVSDTYYDYTNLWHGLCAMAPFVGWSIKNECLKPKIWVLFHWGELRSKMGVWLENLMRTNFGDVKVDGLEEGDQPYCFEKAVVMRHNEGGMSKEKKLQVLDLLRCTARRFCGIDPVGKGKEVNERGEPIIRLTLLMRRGSRSFKNATAVMDIFSGECAKVEGCILRVAQSEDLSFCDQVRVLTYTDIVASPHGAQLTNMLFMDRNSSVMEFFPKGWLELAGVGQYAHHWMADQSGMIHQGTWWEPLGEKECPSPQHDLDCFNFYKDGKIGHNQTHFAAWAQHVLIQVRAQKLEDIENSINKPQPHQAVCGC
ncbi:uncharacterized protein LOC126666079 [Mercurialis annua]|uniref:uncharacterized protein LOC126666079 n=1 Tax=Mercurialis annua TaxID=3986 RepID=UPI00215E54F8|nr:uncharacterized protein LOC126666079 [Mercurialis annua]